MALGAYVIVNVFLWILWAVTDDDKNGLPWPFWITLFWGVGMAFSAYNIFMRRPISEIDKPPPVNPSEAQLRCSPDQLEFSYA